jgi:hypothetical protein
VAQTLPLDIAREIERRWQLQSSGAAQVALSKNATARKGQLRSAGINCTRVVRVAWPPPVECAILKMMCYMSHPSRLKSSSTARINAFLRGSCPPGLPASTDSR